MRTLDIIDVNRLWTVYIGSRCGVAYRQGTIRAPDRFAAFKEARARWPDIRIGFVEEDDI